MRAARGGTRMFVEQDARPSMSTKTQRELSATPPTAAPHVHVELLSQPRYLAGARDLVSAIAKRFGFDDHDCARIALSVDEALCNVIRHGYDRREDGRIWIKLWPVNLEGAESGGIQLVIEDEARQIDPDKIKGRDLEDVRPGGLGVFIMREVMDLVHFEKRTDSDRGMRLVMIKRTGPENAKAESDGNQR
jgi:anti-sigma regulatory factor (Ser/Thr protein kinase)